MPVKTTTLLFFFFFATASTQAQKQPWPPSPRIAFDVDLRAIAKDRLTVRCYLPERTHLSIESDTIRFNFPKIVPGIYGAMDFGQYVQDFQAFDTRENPLPATRLDRNTWLISGARNLAQVQYKVNDTWDDFTASFEAGFFKSAGSMFKEKEVFLINHNCLFGYFEGMKDIPQVLTIHKPAGFFGATALWRHAPEVRDETVDQFMAATYGDLVDAPILYARPDTAQIIVGNTNVLVAVYAETPGRYAPNIAAGLRSLLERQQDYLGGKLPVDRYAFLIYHTPPRVEGNYAGDALEHSRSSFYLFMTEGLESVSGMVRDIAAHEFFHIVTPLNIHSEEIEHYDFNAPRMSRHLWLYEGMTEYATMHMPVKQGLVNLKTFLETVEDKIRKSGRYRDDLALTDLSLHALDLQDQYYNVYLKGALFGLCLDATLRESSNGAYGTQDLLRDLSARYGPDKPFRDEALFDEIAALTRPGIRDFFRRYAEGTEPLPLKECFEKAGIRYERGRLKPDGDASEAALAFRKAWLGQ